MNTIYAFSIMGFRDVWLQLLSTIPNTSLVTELLQGRLWFHTHKPNAYFQKLCRMLLEVGG